MNDCVHSVIRSVPQAMVETEIVMNDGTEVKARFKTKEGLRNALVFLLSELQSMPMRDSRSDPIDK